MVCLAVLALLAAQMICDFESRRGTQQNLGASNSSTWVPGPPMEVAWI